MSRVPGIIVVGSQWGDEGKGKVVDLFSSEADVVVRYQGGANAGHTLVVDGKKTILHLIPSGILHPQTTCVISAGVVLDVEIVTQEIKALREAGLVSREGQLLISDSCTLILPYHRMIDKAREEALGQEKIGTTGKGIGPAYEDRASRKAVLFRDIFEPETLREKLKAAMLEKNYLLKDYYKIKEVNVDEVYESLMMYAKQLAEFRCKDASLFVYNALRMKRRVLFEGAQGTLLDLLHGTYPYVTSSSTLAGSACVGTGVGPASIEKVIGITKAYSTRVGGGPFPTELSNDIGERLRKEGHEFGSTTGRPRRCGWLDLVALKYAIRINGISHLALMKLDVLSGFDEIFIATSYDLDGQTVHEMPTSTSDLSRVKPIYRPFKGWKDDLSKARSVRDFPREAQEYISFLGVELGTPIDVVSVGPGREQTLWIKPLFEK